MANDKKNRRLGKGLDSLFGSYEPQENDVVRMISVNLIDNNPEQPRKQFNEEKLNELAESIRQHGIVQPLIVKKNGERYVIIAGERRFRAARIAELGEVPAIVRDMDGREVMEVALIENIQRENLNPIEEAAAIRFLMKEHDLTQDEVAKRLQLLLNEDKSQSASRRAGPLLRTPCACCSFRRPCRNTCARASSCPVTRACSPRSRTRRSWRRRRKSARRAAGPSARRRSRSKN